MRSKGNRDILSLLVWNVWEEGQWSDRAWLKRIDIGTKMNDQVILRSARIEHSSKKRRSSGSERKNVENKKAQCRNERMKKMRRHGDIGAMVVV